MLKGLLGEIWENKYKGYGGGGVGLGLGDVNLDDGRKGVGGLMGEGGI
ncbi:hypothetical protein [Leuconostoc mesenteroides]|nr:hypothetical protein [Leuconostoc mesenteroides]